MKMMDYVLSDSGRTLLMNTTKMYRDLMVNKEITTENIKQAHILGWSMELVSLLSIAFIFLEMFVLSVIVKILCGF